MIPETPDRPRAEDRQAFTPMTAVPSSQAIIDRRQSIAKESTDYAAYQVSTPEDAQHALNEEDDFPIIVNEVGSPEIDADILALMHAHNARIAEKERTELIQMIDEHNRRLYLSRPTDMFRYLMEKITFDLEDVEATDEEAVNTVLMTHLSDTGVEEVSTYPEYKTYALQLIKNKTDEFEMDVETNGVSEPDDVWARIKGFLRI